MTQTSSQSNSSSAEPPRAVKSLTEFLQAQKIARDQWDLLFFGDGSGLSWKMGGGFAVFLVDGRKQLRSNLIAARTLATVNRMELGAYTEALSYHYEHVLERKLTDPPYKVWIFSDSEFTVRAGSGEYVRKANGDLWQAIDWFETRGYRCQWRWVPRNSTPFHELADELAGRARTAINALRVSHERLFELMPYADPTVGEHVELINCQCGTPLLPGSAECPICGTKQ
jgi:ribonuclease HI